MIALLGWWCFIQPGKVGILVITNDCTLLAIHEHSNNYRFCSKMDHSGSFIKGEIASVEFLLE